MKEKWDLSCLYFSMNEWNNDYEFLKNQIKYLKININLLKINELIKKYENILEIKDKLKGYVKLKYDEDNNRNLEIYFSKVYDIEMSISKITAIVNNKIICNKLDVDIEYSRYVEELTNNQEKTVKYEIFSEINKKMIFNERNFQVLLNKIRFGKIDNENNIKYTLTLNSYNKYIKSKDRILRKNAFVLMEKVLKENSNLFFDYLYNYINNNIELSMTLGYEKCIDRNLKTEEIDFRDYNLCINYIEKNKKIFEDYIRIKKKIINVDKMQLYDIYAITVQDENNILTYSHAKKIIIAALSVLGKEYVTIVEEIFNDNWIDCFERKNKTNSAFSYNIYGNHPYILANYQCTLNDVFTLAHEIGHAVHYYLANKNQSYINAQVTSLLTEIIAMTNECLVFKYLLKEEEGCKKEIISIYLNKFMTILCKQSILNKFETIIYEKIANEKKINANTLSKIYAKTLKYYYGDSIALEDDIYEWTKIIHFYKNFQIYKYIIAFCASINISDNIDSIRDNYIYILKLGRKKKIKELLKFINVDIERDIIYKNTFNKFRELIDKYNEIM